MIPTATSWGNAATACHDYVAKMDTSVDSAKRKDPFSPVKTQPNCKKDSGTDEGTSAILEAIKQLTNKVDSLGIQLQQNSIMLANMAKAVEFNAAEIKDCKTQLQVTEKDVAVLKKTKLSQ